jgi:hypothetical protein
LRQAKLRILKKPANAATKKHYEYPWCSKKKPDNAATKTLQISLVQLKKNLPMPRQSTLRIRLEQLKKSANPATKHTTNTPGAAEKISQSRDKQHYEYA